MEMRPVGEIAVRLPAEERAGCEAAFLAFSLLRHDYDDAHGHPSRDIEDYIGSLRMAPSVAVWVRGHIDLSEALCDQVTGPQLLAAGFGPDVLDALGLRESDGTVRVQSGDPLGTATIRTSVGRLACFLWPLRYVNLDVPASGLFLTQV
jgi:hypothetical protein